MSNQSIDANKSANFIKSILDKASYSNTGTLEFMSYQIHIVANEVTMLSHIVTSIQDNICFHTISYKGGFFKVNTFAGSTGVVSSFVGNDADNFLKQVYLSGYSNGSFIDRSFTPPQEVLYSIANGNYGGENIDLFYAYSRREGYSFSAYTTHAGRLSTPYYFKHTSHAYYFAIISAATSLFRDRISNLSMLQYKKYNLDRSMNTEELENHLINAEVVAFHAKKVKGNFVEINLGFKTPDVKYNIVYNQEENIPLSIVVSKFFEADSHVINLDESYKGVVFPFMNYIYRVVEFLFPDSENYYYSFDSVIYEVSNVPPIYP